VTNFIVIKAQLASALKQWFRASIVTASDILQAKVESCLRMIGHFSEDGFKRPHCFVGSPGAGQQHSQVRQWRNDIRIEPERQTVFLLGIVELPSLIKNCPEQVVSVRIARCYGDYLPQNWFR